VAPGYGYGIVAMAALGYGGPQLWASRLRKDFTSFFTNPSQTKQTAVVPNLDINSQLILQTLQP